MGRYPFDVELFHLLLHAGLSRRTRSRVGVKSGPQAAPWAGAQRRDLTPTWNWLLGESRTSGAYLQETLASLVRPSDELPTSARDMLALWALGRRPSAIPTISVAHVFIEYVPQQLGTEATSRRV